MFINKKNRNIYIAACIPIGILSAIVLFKFKTNYRVSLKEYKRYALYMAHLDEMISRNELEGNAVSGQVIIMNDFEKSIKNRYKYYLEINKGKSKEELEQKILNLKKRLSNSINYISKNTDLKIEFID